MASQCIDCTPGLSGFVDALRRHMEWVVIYPWSVVLNITTHINLRMVWWLSWVLLNLVLMHDGFYVA